MHFSCGGSVAMPNGAAQALTASWENARQAPACSDDADAREPVETSRRQFVGTGGKLRPIEPTR